jgi:hypothetical protein
VHRVEECHADEVLEGAQNCRKNKREACRKEGVKERR